MNLIPSSPSRSKTRMFLVLFVFLTTALGQWGALNYYEGGCTSFSGYRVLFRTFGASCTPGQCVSLGGNGYSKLTCHATDPTPSNFIGLIDYEATGSPCSVITGKIIYLNNSCVYARFSRRFAKCDGFVTRADGFDLSDSTCSVVSSLFNATSNACVSNRRGFGCLTPASQVVQFGIALSQVAGTTTAHLASATSGLSVVVSSSTSSICSVSGGMVTFLTSGTCLLQGFQAGNQNYYSATASVSISVSPAPTTSTVSTLSTTSTQSTTPTPTTTSTQSTATSTLTTSSTQSTTTPTSTISSTQSTTAFVPTTPPSVSVYRVLRVYSTSSCQSVDLRYLEAKFSSSCFPSSSSCEAVGSREYTSVTCESSAPIPPGKMAGYRRYNAPGCTSNSLVSELYAYLPETCTGYVNPPTRVRCIAGQLEGTTFQGTVSCGRPAGSFAYSLNCNADRKAFCPSTSLGDVWTVTRFSRAGTSRTCSGVRYFSAEKEGVAVCEPRPCSCSAAGFCTEVECVSSSDFQAQSSAEDGVVLTTCGSSSSPTTLNWYPAGSCVPTSDSTSIMKTCSNGQVTSNRYSTGDCSSAAVTSSSESGCSLGIETSCTTRSDTSIDDGGGVSLGLIIGCVVGGLLLISLIVAIIVCVVIRKKRTQAYSDEYPHSTIPMEANYGVGAEAERLAMASPDSYGTHPSPYSGADPSPYSGADPTPSAPPPNALYGNFRASENAKY